MTVVFIIYFVWVLCLTLSPVPMANPQIPTHPVTNYVPVINSISEFKASFSGNLEYLKVQFIENLFGNILLFIPFGFFLPLILQRITFKKLFLYALLYSASIETFQYFISYIGIYRTVDIDDVILNASGAVIGFFTLRLFPKLKKAAALNSGQ